MGPESPRTASLQFLSKKLKQEISDDCGDGRDFQVGGRKDIVNGPHKASLPSHTRALEFSHQKIGVKKEDDESDLNRRSPDMSLHKRHPTHASPTPVQSEGVACTVAHSFVKKAY